MGALAGSTALGKLLGGCARNESDSSTAGITTLVVLCMENRSYDHVLGARALQGLGGDGLVPGMSNSRLDGTIESIFHTEVPEVPDPPHSWESSRKQFADGQNSGFMREYQRRIGEAVPPHVMGYFTDRDQPFSWALADAYATSDRWFASLMGPTWPNRMYLHSGQSGALTVNELPTSGGIDWPSIHHQLNEAGIDWSYYYQDLPFVPLFKNLDVSGHVRRVNNEFWLDARDGNLAPVTWIEPNFSLNDDHPPRHPMLGQQFMASVYAALAQGPQWNNCMFVVLYDEHGGFHDHVAPPLADDARANLGFDQLGFRVPAFVAGPYIKNNYVSSVVRDHCSVLSHITKLYGLDPLTERVAWAPDLLDFIDLDRLAKGQPAPPIAMPEIIVDESMIDAAVSDTNPSQPELAALADSGFIPPHYCDQHRTREHALMIGEAAESLGAGRIRLRR